MSKIKTDGLDRYGAVPFEQQQPGTAGVEGVNCLVMNGLNYFSSDKTSQSSPAAAAADYMLQLLLFVGGRVNEKIRVFRDNNNTVVRFAKFRAVCNQGLKRIQKRLLEY